MPAIVIQAADPAGLLAAAARLTSLPEDFVTPSVRAARSGLFRELHIGGRPEGRATGGLTGAGLITATRPRPFRIRFGEMKPFAADQEPVPADVPLRPATAVPGIVLPPDYSAEMRDGDRYVVEAGPGGMGKADLRFSDAIAFDLEVKRAGPLALAVDGLFRYYDRQPCTAPQWEDVLAMRARYLKGPRQPVFFDVLVDGKPAGRLDKTVTGQHEVQLEMYAPSGQKPKSAVEEVVVEVSGAVPLSSGRHTILLVHRNITDGQLHRVRLEMEKTAADAVEQKLRRRRKRRRSKEEERKQKAAKKK